MVRRTSWHYYHRDAAQKATLVADWMKQILAWSDATLADELARYRNLLSRVDTEPSFSPVAPGAAAARSV